MSPERRPDCPRRMPFTRQGSAAPAPEVLTHLLYPRPDGRIGTFQRLASRLNNGKKLEAGPAPCG